MSRNFVNFVVRYLNIWFFFQELYDSKQKSQFSNRQILFIQLIHISINAYCVIIALWPIWQNRIQMCHGRGQISRRDTTPPTSMSFVGINGKWHVEIAHLWHDLGGSNNIVHIHRHPINWKVTLERKIAKKKTILKYTFVTFKALPYWANNQYTKVLLEPFTR